MPMNLNLINQVLCSSEVKTLIIGAYNVSKYFHAICYITFKLARVFSKVLPCGEIPNLPSFTHEVHTPPKVIDGGHPKASMSQYKLQPV